MENLTITERDTNRSYALYDPEHIENIVKRTRDIIKDVEYSIGLSKESRQVLLDKAVEHLDFIGEVMEDSMDSTLKGVKFKRYSDRDEECCKDEAPVPAES